MFGLSGPDFFGHLGYIFVLLGMYLIGKKNLWGWAARGVGEFLWLGVGLYIGMSSIYIWSVFFLALDLKGFLAWRKEKKAS